MSQVTLFLEPNPECIVDSAYFGISEINNRKK